MTIGVGVLCSAELGRDASRANTIVLVASDTGTVQADYRWDDLHKVFVYPDEKLFGVCLGHIEMAEDLLPSIEGAFQQLTARNQLSVAAALNKAVLDHRLQHFQFDVLPSYRFLAEEIPVNHQPEVLEAWQRYDVGIQLIVGTFDDDGRALMYVVARMEGIRGLVHRTLFPGVATIGHGAQSANFWLSYRRQSLGKSLRESAYHAYEATRLALRDRGRRGRSELITATTEEAFHLTNEHPAPEGCPVSLSELETMFDRYGPRETSDLGPSEISDSSSRG
jgi:hypothetical protein